MAPTASSTTLASGITLSFAATGEPSDAVVLLLPGPTDSWRSYEPVLRHFPSYIRAIAVSQRGHGDSDKPATGYSVEDFAADVPPLLDALDVGRAVLAGHSGSCLVARRVAIDHPDRVAGLVLEASPTTLVADAALQAFTGSIVSTLEDPISPEFARALVVDTSSGDLPPAVLAELSAELLKVPARVWRETFSSLLSYDDLSELRRIAAPALLVWGDADRLVDRGMQDALRDRIPVTELVVYRGVGHTPRWEDPVRFAGDVAAFVERASSSAASGPGPRAASQGSPGAGGRHGALCHGS
jgi:pimeloyl-ACP methyl ester carboxylesterase